MVVIRSLEKPSVVEIALKRLKISPRELAYFIAESKRTFISEPSVYRILKSYDLVTSPGQISMETVDEFHYKTKQSQKPLDKMKKQTLEKRRRKFLV